MCRWENVITYNVVCKILQDNVTAKKCLTKEIIKDALDKLRGAVMIVYPMGLPPHDPIKEEFDNTEELSGTQVATKKCSNIITHHTPSYFVQENC